jgi:hypothetical protein
MRKDSSAGTDCHWPNISFHTAVQILALRAVNSSALHWAGVLSQSYRVRQEETQKQRKKCSQ